MIQKYIEHHLAEAGNGAGAGAASAEKAGGGKGEEAAKGGK
jgi:hypothetical protein